jgi:hypothetical protein
MGAAIRRHVAALALFALAAGAASHAAACSFHTYLPALTVVDRLLQAERIVLARPGPADRFRYGIVGVLKGDVGGTANIADLVDSTTRRRLAANAGDAVLFAFDDAEQRWLRLAYLDDVFRGLVDAVLAGAGAWTTAEDPARFALTAGFLQHRNSELRSLALMELDRAPYGVLRSLDLGIDADSVVAEMHDFSGLAYLPIRILLLGLSDAESARREIRGGIDRAAAGPVVGKSLGAYATALIEIDGAVGIDRLAAAFFADPAQPPDKIELVIEALAIHNQAGDPDLRPAIAGVLDVLVAARPEAAVLIARRFGERQDWTQADRLGRLLRDRSITSAPDVVTVSVYVGMARQAMTGADAGRSAARPDGASTSGSSAMSSPLVPATLAPIPTQ